MKKIHDLGGWVRPSPSSRQDVVRIDTVLVPSLVLALTLSLTEAQKAVYLAQCLLRSDTGIVCGNQLAFAKVREGKTGASVAIDMSHGRLRPAIPQGD